MFGLGLRGFLVSVDLFCGGGGASLGIHNGSGAAPAVAVNHCEHAIEMHAVNHPETLHFKQSVWDVSPGACIPGRMVDLLWASPDCTHFSKAKGGKPKSSEIRSLANVVLHWARSVGPKVVMIENVVEFLTWGPLHPMDHDDPKLRGQPIKSAKGDLFRAWKAGLEDAGYTVEWKELRACDYGAPTTRKRLFIIARLDGDIVWPEPTHGPGREHPYRTAAECIDFHLPALSIFATKDEAKAFAREHGGRPPRRPMAENTMARIAEGVRRYVVDGDPFLLDIANQGGRGAYVYNQDEPLRTVTAKASHCVVSPHLVNTRNGERKGQRPRVRSVLDPYPTVTAKGSQGAVANVHMERVSAFIAKHNGGVVGQQADEPLHTITSRDTKALIQAHLSKQATARANAVAAFIVKFYGSGSQWSQLSEPMHTVVSKARMGLVTVEIDGETYAIVDITMRMLTPRELARAQGFPDTYILHGSKKDQIARIGNSVCPQVVEALVRANFPHGAGTKPKQMPMYGNKFGGAA